MWGPEQDHPYYGIRHASHPDPFGEAHYPRPQSHGHAMPPEEMNSEIKEQIKADLTFTGTLHPAVTVSGVPLGPIFDEDDSNCRQPARPVSSTPSTQMAQEHIALTYDAQLLKQNVQPEMVGKTAGAVATVDSSQPVEDPLPQVSCVVVLSFEVDCLIDCLIKG